MMRLCGGLALLLLGVCFRAPRFKGTRSGSRNDAMARRLDWPASSTVVPIRQRILANAHRTSVAIPVSTLG
jgi:hypothetical protein